MLDTNHSISTISTDQMKMLWNRPGGKFAKFTSVLAAGGIGYMVFKALPFLIAGTANLLFFIGELVVLAAVISILCSKSFWKWISLFWLQLNRKILGFFVKIDPISILENGIKELYHKLNIVDVNITKLDGTLTGMKKSRDDYQHTLEELARKKSVLESKAQQNLSNEELIKYKTNYQLTCNNIARTDRILKNTINRINTTEKYLDVLKRLRTMADFKIKDSESELNVQKEEYKAAKSEQSVLKAFKNIMAGGMSRSLEEELALEHIADTVNTNIAEMNQFVDGSNSLLTDFDIENEVNVEKANEIISKYEQNGFKLLTDKSEVTVSIPKQKGHAYNEVTNSNNKYF